MPPTNPAMLLLCGLVLCSCHLLAAESPVATPTADWLRTRVPGTWEETAGLNYDGIAWYRCFVMFPAEWAGKEITLAIESVDNCHEAYVNGAKVGGAGRFPPDYQNGLDSANRYL